MVFSTIIFLFRFLPITLALYYLAPAKLKNTVLFPFLLSPLLVKSPRSRRLIDEVLVSPDRLLICSAVRNETESSPMADDVYEVGTVMRIVKMLKFPDDSYRLLVQGVARVRVTENRRELASVLREISQLEKDLARAEAMILENSREILRRGRQGITGGELAEFTHERERISARRPWSWSRLPTS